MLKFRAAAFYEATVALAQVRGILNIAEALEPAHQKTKVNESNAQGVIASFESLAAHLSELGAGLAEMEAQRLLAALKITPRKITYGELREKLQDVDSRLRDELTLTTLYVLDRQRRHYAETQQPPFGEEVTEVLPFAIPDIEDAGKCLALNMGTASVFHSMRVMEAALKALAAMLGIPYAPSWESYISQIEKCINEKHKRKTVRWKKDEPFFREILGNLQTIKIAWRNPTMHVVRRYSTEEAEEIYIAVRALLKRVAPRLPKPKPVKPTLEQLLS